MSDFMNDFTNEKNRTILQYFKDFVRHPIKTIGQHPPWPVEDMRIVLFVFVLISLSAGLLAGLLSRSFLKLIGSILFFPISGIILSFILAFAFLLLFVIFYEKTSEFDEKKLRFLELHRIAVLALMPYQVLRIFMGFSFIGFFIEILAVLWSLFLMSEGFIQQLKLPKRNTWVISLGICGVVLLFKTIFFFYF